MNRFRHIFNCETISTGNKLSILASTYSLSKTILIIHTKMSARALFESIGQGGFEVPKLFNVEGWVAVGELFIHHVRGI